MPIVIPTPPTCSYCDNFAGNDPWHGTPAVIHEDSRVYGILAPASLGGVPGHSLVIPRRHVTTIFDLTEDEEAALAHAVARTARALRDTFDMGGLIVNQRNGLAAEQSVPHVHFHVIPIGDGSTWPPTEWVEITSADTRAEQAQAVRANF